jgi:diguanylate cyclase (GGDEF)-like protein
MNQRLKIYATVFIALIIGGAFFYVNDMTRRQTVGRLTLLGMVGELEKLEEELEVEVLQSSFFLYHNYDDINGVLSRIETKFDETRRCYREVNPGEHPASTAIFSRYQAAFSRKKEGVMLFLTANSVIKNSSMYLPVLLRKYIESCRVDPVYLDRISTITSSVYLAKNGLDQELVSTLGAAVTPLQRLAPADPKAALLHQAFVSHLQVFANYFPNYSGALNAILAPSTTDLLLELRRHLTTEDQRWLARLNLISLAFLLAFLASIGMIIVLLLRTGRENVKLVELQGALTAAATTDRLTGLANRFAFDSDVEQLREPLLYLVNIDDFKHINDLYGVRAGDFVLRALAERLGQMLPPPIARLYRLGGDDFGILTEEPSESNKDLFAQILLEIIENEAIAYHDQLISVEISIGVSTQRPLLETADMALKKVKRQARLKYLIYSDALNIQSGIAANLKTLTTVRHALENDGVLAYFQPIVDNRTGAVAKFECLVRMRAEDGAILSPFAFLDTIKESSLYPAMTKAVINKSFQAFRGNDCEFSVNLSVTDMLDQSVHEFILAKLREEPDLARRLTVEILEGEGVENYEVVHNFIGQIKAHGCKIAIDDFGAGYSNFAHVLKLQVDTLKIDASLIRQLDIDSNARILVGTIVDFCRKLNIQTVAEFVHSEPVHRAVCSLGIDYTQGYYLGKPEPELPVDRARAVKA